MLGESKSPLCPSKRSTDRKFDFHSRSYSSRWNGHIEEARIRLMSIAHVWLLPEVVVSSANGSADAAASAFFCMPRDLLEYQP